MKKGLPRIIIGCILIFFQLLSVIGNSLTGNHLGIHFTSFYAFLGDLITLLSYYSIGIIGTILLISGIVVYNHKEDSSNKKEKRKNSTLPWLAYDAAIESHKQTLDTNVVESDPTHMPKPKCQEINTTNKHRYCRLCGSLIDPVNKKCSGCGKQYFRIRRLLKYVLFIGVIILCIILTFTIQENILLQQELIEKDTLILQLTEENNALISKVNDNLEENVSKQYDRGYAAGKNIGYQEGYIQGQLDGPADKYEEFQSRLEKRIEELNKKQGNSNN